MDPTATTDLSDKRRQLIFSGLAALPFVLPVGLFGVRALWPRPLRDATRGAIALGVLSLIGLGVSAFTRVQGEQPSGGDRWKLPRLWPLMPEEFAASAASGH